MDDRVFHWEKISWDNWMKREGFKRLGVPVCGQVMGDKDHFFMDLGGVTCEKCKKNLWVSWDYEQLFMTEDHES